MDLAPAQPVDLGHAPDLYYPLRPFGLPPSHVAHCMDNLGG